MQKLGAFLSEMLAHHRGEDLGAAQPTAKADQLRELLILQLVHRPLDATLRAIQLLRTLSHLRLSAASVIAFACGVMEAPTPIPLASESTRCPISFTAGASCACTAMNPSAITLPRSSAVLGRSLKLTPFSVRTNSFQFTGPSLLRAAKTSFGNGTTTSSTFLYCFTSICWGTGAACALNPITASVNPAHLLILSAEIIGCFDC